MARPKTVASTYQMVTFRMPQELRAYVQRLTEASGAPFNTELIKIMRLGVATKEKIYLAEVSPAPCPTCHPAGGKEEARPDALVSARTE